MANNTSPWPARSVLAVVDVVVVVEVAVVAQAVAPLQLQVKAPAHLQQAQPRLLRSLQDKLQGKLDRAPDKVELVVVDRVVEVVALHLKADRRLQ